MRRVLYIAAFAFLIVLPTIAWEASITQNLAIGIGNSAVCQGNAGCVAGLVLVFDDEFTDNQLEYVSNQTPTWTIKRTLSERDRATRSDRKSPA
jgi:hypothetical protein